jgi:hypothetical protein
VWWRGRLLVLRELALASPPVEIAAGERRCWDRRFSVAAVASGFTVGYLGHGGGELPDAARGAGLPRLVYPVLPACWDDRGLAAVPHIDYRRVGLAMPPRLVFRPPRGLTEAGFTVV